MRIGITGAGGFLGAYLTDYLAEQGARIVCLNRSASFADRGHGKSVEHVVGDLNSKPICAEFVSRVDVIVHLAHANSPLVSNRDVLSDATLNLLPSLNLLEAIKESGQRKHLVYASSGGAVYGESRDRRPFTEMGACFPNSSYGIQKLTVENYIRMYAQSGWLDGTVLRISNPYGTLLPGHRRQGLIGVVVNRMMHGEAVRIFGNPNNVRDYIHLADMARAVSRCLETPESLRTYNIGSGHGHSVADVLVLIEKHLQCASRKEFIDTPETRALCDWAVLDIRKAAEELDWSPRINLDSGLRDLCAQGKPASQ